MITIAAADPLGRSTAGHSAASAASAAQRPEEQLILRRAQRAAPTCTDQPDQPDQLIGTDGTREHAHAHMHADMHGARAGRRITIRTLRRLGDDESNFRLWRTCVMNVSGPCPEGPRPAPPRLLVEVWCAGSPASGTCLRVSGPPGLWLQTALLS